MNVLFVFNNHTDNFYKKELKIAWDLFTQKSPESSKISMSDFSLHYIQDKNVDVVVSNGLPVELYDSFHGLKVVNITFDKMSTYSHLADIVIDFQSESRDQYFTGPTYQLKPVNELEIFEVISLITKLEWDSRFFDFGVSFLGCHHLTESISYRVNQFVKNHSIRLVEYLCNCHDQRSVLLAEKEGYHFVDIRLSFSQNLDPVIDSELPAGITYGLASKEHILNLRSMSEGLYKDSRYFFDKHFPIDLVREFYRLWVEKAVLGLFDHECHCLFDQKEPIGFCTIRYNSKRTANIGLFGLRPDYQNRGLAKNLIKHAIGEIYRNGIETLSVVTQGRNYTAQRLYQSCGFRTQYTELWYHKWF